MKNFLIAFLVFLIWSVFGLWLYSLLQDNGTSSSAEVHKSVLTSQNPPLIEEDTAPPYDRIDNIPIADKSISGEKKKEEKIAASGLRAENENGEILFEFSDGIAILENSSEIDIPDSLLAFKDKLYSYLSTHPDKEVHIQSIYSPNENIETPNLGITRGTKIKNILLDSGLEEDRVVIKPTIKDVTFDSEGTFSNAISFQIKPLDLERIKNKKEALPTKKVIYPKFSNSGIQVDGELTELLNEIKEITRNNPEVVVQVVGHTDNIGNATDNHRLGLVYARQVRWYLVTKGSIDRSRIKAISKGESDPIDTNKSKRGRMANRRIEILFM